MISDFVSSWRLPGCSSACWPRSHDPSTHENYGCEMERERVRRETEPHPIIRTGPLTIDRDAYTVEIGTTRLHLTSRQWLILAHLTHRIGRVCAYDDIIAAAWGGDAVLPYSVNRRGRHDRHMLRTAIYRLRASLGPAGAQIVTMPPHGLMLTREPPS